MSTLSPKSIDLKTQISPELLKYPSVKVALKELETLRNNGVIVEVLEAEEEDFRTFNGVFDKVRELFKEIKRISIGRETLRIEGEVYANDPITRVVEIERSLIGFHMTIIDKAILKCYNGDNNSWEREIAKYNDTIVLYNRRIKVITEWWLEVEVIEESRCIKAVVVAELKYPVESVRVLREALALVNALHDYVWGEIDSLQL